jgi:hypothetical protein
VICERCDRGERRYHNLNGYGHRVCPHFWIPCSEKNNGKAICCELKPSPPPSAPREPK